MKLAAGAHRRRLPEPENRARDFPPPGLFGGACDAENPHHWTPPGSGDTLIYPRKTGVGILESEVSVKPGLAHRFVLAWAELHQGELEENWRPAREGGTVKSIEPLR